MAQTEQQHDTIDTMTSRFNRAIRIERGSMIAEKIVPLILPTAAVAGASYSALLSAWDYMPPYAQQLGVIGALAAIGATSTYSLIRTFGKKSNSPFIGKKQAIDSIDRAIGAGEKPAARIADHAFSASNNPEKEAVFNFEKLLTWKKWKDKIEDRSFKTGLGAYYKDKNLRAGSHIGIAAATALSASLLGEGAFQKFEDALYWTPPPPPLQYHVWVTPPRGIEGANGYLQEALDIAAEHNLALSVHQGSVLSVITYDRTARITAGGEEILPLVSSAPAPATPQNRERNQGISYTYEIPFTGAAENLGITIEDYTLNFVITPDNAPELRIIEVAPNASNAGQTDIEYSIRDDFGVSSVEIRPKDQRLLPSAVLPTITLPTAPPSNDTPQP